MTQSKTNSIILATRNAGKIRELAQALKEYGLEVLGLEDYAWLEDIEESGATFEENALLKAQYVADKTGLIAIADDSGLEVSALEGAPGVYSARYADDLAFLEGESRDERNNRKLLTDMQHLAPEQRNARFVCVMAACKPFGRHLVVRGTWEGRILEQAQGENGFGYDPLFFDLNLQRSAASLSKEEKNARSHRGQALRKLLEQWQTFLMDAHK